MPAIPARLLELAPADRLQLEAWLAEFEEAWDEGRLAAQVERLPPPGQPLRLPALIELVKIDLERSWQRGRHLSLTDYAARYPELGPAEALPSDLILAEDEVCRQFGEAPGTLLAAPDGAAAGPPTLAPPAPPAASRVPCVRGYEVLGKLGQGGMGAVYQARHLRLNRVVALKVVGDAPNARPADLVRFRQEAEMIARLQHANIVQIYEVGEYAGGSYLALECVDGPALDRQVNGIPQPPREAARLVETLARAVHYAHGQGVIHRDLKPANVLLTAAGVPKITDFGLARPVAVESGLTTAGAVLGTPSYMAPEQADGRLKDIGPHSDVYALGAVLYECLTGRPPFRGATVLDTLAQVRGQEPVPPHRLLGSNRRACPADLETICLKCLHKEPAKRYGSAEALAEDLRRFGADEPIHARPAGRAERLWRWCRRKPAVASLVASAGLLLITVVVALAAGLWAVNREKDRTEEALHAEARARQRARQALDEMTSQVIEDWLARQKYLEPMHQEFLEKALKHYEEFARESGDTEEIRHDVARAYLRIGQIHKKLGDYAQAEAALRHAQGLLHQLVADFPAAAAHRRELARSYSELGGVLKHTGRLEAAEAAFAADQALIQELAADFPGVRGYRDDLVVSYANMANLRQETGRPEAAEADYREALKICKQLDAEFPGNPRHRFRLAKTYNSWGFLLQRTSRTKEAEEAFRAALAITEPLVAESPGVPDYRDHRANTFHNLGILLAYSNRLEDAVTAYREGLALNQRLAADFPGVPDHRAALARSYSNLGVVFRKLKRPDDAEAAYREAVVIQQRLVEDYPKVTQNRVELAFSYNLLGVLFDSTGRLEQAEKPFRDALAQRQHLAEEFRKVPEYQNDVAGTLGNLARLSRKRKDLTGARLLLERAQPYHQAALKADPRHPFYRQFFSNNQSLLGEILVDLGEHAAAVESVEPLVRFAYRPGSDIYDAACIVSRCVRLVEQDAQLPEARRRELACSYADRAMELLRQAVGHGYQNVVQMKKDSDLDPLRSRKDFQQLLADLEAKAPGK
jgi:tetratricopeptide (TPR) repeat protein